MKPLRGAFALAVLAVLAIGAFHALRGLRAVGTYDRSAADLIAASTQSDRHAGNAVTAVTFDYRGFDTLGEEFILFGTTMGISILLRQQRQAAEEKEREAYVKKVEEELTPVSPAVRGLGSMFIAPTLLFGLYLAAHGHLTPGSGFQAGVVMSAALALIFLSARKIGTGPMQPVSLLELVEGFSLAAFAAIGFVGLVLTGAYLTNVLPYGTINQLLSAGTIPVLSMVTGFAVTAGVTLIAAELLEQKVLSSKGEE